ncbi:MAG TPA: hypothetical protein VHM20_01340 [Gammaproteobacteria bacterium]|jgi:hypothetical protein|nr:hypothetical protein [Gammaproteobacteria bacterium]
MNSSSLIEEKTLFPCNEIVRGFTLILTVLHLNDLKKLDRSILAMLFKPGCGVIAKTRLAIEEILKTQKKSAYEENHKFCIVELDMELRYIKKYQRFKPPDKNRYCYFGPEIPIEAIQKIYPSADDFKGDLDPENKKESESMLKNFYKNGIESQYYSKTPLSRQQSTMREVYVPVLISNSADDLPHGCFHSIFLTINSIKKVNFTHIARMINQYLKNQYQQVGKNIFEAIEIINQHSWYKASNGYLFVKISVRSEQLAFLSERYLYDARHNSRERHLTLISGTRMKPENIISIQSSVNGAFRFFNPSTQSSVENPPSEAPSIAKK